MKFFSSLIMILFVSATWCLSAKRKTQSDKGLSAREEVTENNLRNEGRDEESRNVTKLYDSVHKYHGRRKKAISAKRQYLGSLNGLQSMLSNSKHKNGLNGLPTGEVGARADDPSTAYIDAAHGVSAAVHAQKLQVGTQPEEAHQPFEEGLSPLPIYHKRQPVISAGRPSPIHTLDGPHIGSAHHIATDQTVAAAPQDAAISAVNAPLTQGHVHNVDHFTTNVAATSVTGNDASVLDRLQHLDGTSLINEIHKEDLSLLSHPIHDHVNGINDYANVHDVGHHTADYLAAAQVQNALAQANDHSVGQHAADYLAGAEIQHASAQANEHDVGHHTAEYLAGADVQHALAHQVPYEIQRPPIHVAKNHHHTSFETVDDEGEVKYHPCLNGGVYVSTGYTSYECICPEQLIGKNCQDTNHCHPCPCKNKGRCHNIVDLPKYKCTCLPGFYGPQCENKNPCHPNPCKNGGVCSHDGKGNIECVCPSRFKGEKCDELHNCKPNPCQNEGNCIELEGKGKFECQCTSQWRSTVCNKPRFCNQNPCLNGGTCQESHDTFNCICVHGWRGRICNERACKPNPCKNGGTCTETDDGREFKCVCLPWHAGHLCEENRPCLINPCLNGGKCIDSFSGFHWAYGPLQFYCICRPPYQGEKCEIHGCRNCHRNAHCEVDKCVCDEGYRGNGRMCIKKEDPCHPNPCRNDGICVQRGDTAEYDCQCKKPYLPPLCKTKDQCDPNPCKNEGVCTQNPDGSYTCTCPAGSKGVDCEKIDPCLQNPCQHGGTCREENGTATCECKGNWAKPLCKECSCKNKKVAGAPDITCDSEGKCVCPTGYIIDTWNHVCNKDDGGGGSGCDDKPCVNGGECIANGKKDYICKCKTGYVGKNCETKDVCNPNPCKNGGTCKQDQNDKGKFLGCNCPKGFTVQPYCDKVKDPDGGGACNPNPCKNEGQCVKNGKSYDCVCKVRFTGPQCAVDKCANCDANANCVNGRCKCKAGFIGNGYECIKDVPTCEQKCPQYSTCVIPTGNCQCNQGYTFVDQICLPIVDESEETTGEGTTDETTDVKPTVKPTEPTETVTQPATTAPPVTTSAPLTTSSGGGTGGPATINTTPVGPITPTQPVANAPPASSGKGATQKPAGPPALSVGQGQQGPAAAPGAPASSSSSSSGAPSGPTKAPSSGGGGPPSGPTKAPSSSGGGSPSGPAGPASSSGGSPGAPPSSGGGSPSGPTKAPSSSGGGSPSGPAGPASSSGGSPGSPSSSGGSPGSPSSSGSPGSPSSSGGSPGSPSSSGGGSPSGPASGSSSAGPPGNPDSVKSFIKPNHAASEMPVSESEEEIGSEKVENDEIDKDENYDGQ